MQLDKKALGLALGILCGVSVAGMTVLVLIIGGGEHLKLLGRVYIGYSVSPLGVVIGGVYGFLDGLIGGWLIAWLYNHFASGA